MRMRQIKCKEEPKRSRNSEKNVITNLKKSTEGFKCRLG
jgi:hypothetical protein